MGAPIALHEVHPAVRADVANIDEQIASPKGILRDYPEILVALIAQREFVARRPQIVAYNSMNGVRSVQKLMRAEGWEVVEAVVHSIRTGEHVNGHMSKEADDWIIFAGQLGALLAFEGKKIGTLSRAEIALGIAGLRAMTRYFPQFDYLSGLSKTVDENDRNYPIRIMQAPLDWGKPLIAQLHAQEVRPAMKGLRKEMPGGVTKLRPEVSEALERLDMVAPTLINAGIRYQEMYGKVIAIAHKYKM
jgi:hypothetical protein